MRRALRLLGRSRVITLSAIVTMAVLVRVAVCVSFTVAAGSILAVSAMLVRVRVRVPAQIMSANMSNSLYSPHEPPTPSPLAHRLSTARYV